MYGVVDLNRSLLLTLYSLAPPFSHVPMSSLVDSTDQGINLFLPAKMFEVFFPSNAEIRWSRSKEPHWHWKNNMLCCRIHLVEQTHPHTTLTLYVQSVHENEYTLQLFSIKHIDFCFIYIYNAQLLCMCYYFAQVWLPLFSVIGVLVPVG